MRKETSWLLGTASALALGFGISPAYCAQAVLGFDVPAVTDRASPVLDLKGDVNAGLGGIDAGASIGAKDNGSGGADVGAEVGAGVGNADANAGVDAHVGGATGGAGVDADAGVGAGDTSAGAAASGGVSGGSAGAAASGNVNAGAAAIGGGASASMQGAPSAGASGGVAPSHSPDASDGQAAPEVSQLSASVTVDVPPVLVPLLPSGAHQAEDTGIAANQRQRLPVECSDRVVNADCPGFGEPESGALPKPKPLPPEAVSSGSAKTSNRVTGLSASTARTAAPEPAALTSGGLGISLVEPVWKDKGLLVQGIIVNTSDQAQAVPPLHISLLNSAGQLVRYSVTKAPIDTLARGERSTFKIVLRPVPTTVKRLAVSLIPGTP